MKLRGSIFGVFFVLAVASVSLLPISPINKLRNGAAYELVVAGLHGPARWIYAIGKTYGDPLAVNNYHVLNYRRAIDGKGLPAPVREKIASAAKTDFDKLMDTGFAVAAYNRGMFNYTCGPKETCRQIAIAQFERGALFDDIMSQDALELIAIRKYAGKDLNAALKSIADRGNAWAAYLYARHFRHTRNALHEHGKPYALFAAEAGIADAQEFYGSYFDEDPNAIHWLERAATNPINRSLIAADRLGFLAKENGDFKAARKWYQLAATPRSSFEYQLLIHPDGLRWRGFQYFRNADDNTPKNAAYNLALLQMHGKGGPVDKKAARINFAKAKTEYTHALYR